jgi:hypothetical protein
MHTEEYGFISCTLQPIYFELLRNRFKKDRLWQD